MPLNIIGIHTKNCQIRTDLLEIIEDCDKIFLKIDCSATNQLKGLIGGGGNIMKNGSRTPILEERVIKKEDNKLSDRIKKLMNGNGQY